MAQNETPITIVGNIVQDPELRFTPAGLAVCNFRIASTPRQFNKQTNQWEDQEALFLTCNVWRQAAENVAESLTKGMRVIVTGTLRARSYETREGEKRTVMEVEAQEVGPSLTFATAQVARTPSGQRPQQGGQQPAQQAGWGGQSQQGGFSGQQAQSDPWNTQPTGGTTAGANNEPPY